MGGGAPQMPNQQVPQKQPVPQLPENEKRDFLRAETMKNEAADLVKAKNLEGACVKYFAAINAIRLNDQLR